MSGFYVLISKSVAGIKSFITHSRVSPLPGTEAGEEAGSCTGLAIADPRMGRSALHQVKILLRNLCNFV